MGSLKLLFFACLAFGHCYGASKVWLPNTNYDNPKNWNVGRVPCLNDRIMLTGNDATVSVFLQSNATMREITLPMDGVMTLADNMILSFSDEVDPDCEGTDVEFIRYNAEDWYDPDNWQDSEETLVETEMVPCTYDYVVFQENNQYNVLLDTDVSVRQITFDGQDYTSTSSFKSLLDSSVGKEQFTFGSLARFPDVLVENKGCNDVTGCACRRDTSQINAKICGNMECHETLCIDSIRPVGGCCQTCGCTLSMQYDRNQFNLQSFKGTLFNKFGNKVDYSEVRFSTSKTNEGIIQVVAQDDDDGKTAILWCNDVKVDIVKNMHDYGITNVTLLSSGKGRSSKQTGDEPLPAGMLAGIIVAVLVLLAIIIVGALFYRHRSVKKGMYPNGHLEYGAEFINHPTDPSAALRGFDNPMYDTPPKPMDETGTKFNPMYTSAGVLDEDDGMMLGFANPVDIETSFNRDDDDDDDIDDGGDDNDIKKPIDETVA